MIHFRSTSAPPRPFAEPRNKEWHVTHDAADAVLPQLRQAYLTAVGDMTADVSIDNLTRAIWSRSAEQAIRLIDMGILQEDLTNASMDLMREAMRQAGQGSLELLPGYQIDYSFDMLNPRAVDWLSVNSASLVTGVTDNTVEALRYILRRSFVDGIPPRDAAVLIRKVVGLLPQHATAVYNYRQELIAKGMVPRRIDDLVEGYADRLLTFRAEMIARTETIRAASMGQHEGWRQAVGDGLLDPARTRRKWIVTPDDRLSRDRCAPMAGQQRGLEEEFQTGLGNYVLTPPSGPNCRCAVGLVFLKE
jgi:hypothetical protein